MVDYLQLMSPAAGAQRRNGSREQDVSSFSRGLKALAKELHVPVIALSQLNRGLEDRADKRPMLSDLRESGAIEQDADTVLAMYRPRVYDKDSTDLDECIVLKQRSGPLGTAFMRYRGDQVTFEECRGGRR